VKSFQNLINQNSFTHIVKGFSNECIGKFEDAMKDYESVGHFFDTKNRAIINDRILLCKFYSNTDKSLDIFNLASTVDYTSSMNQYIELSKGNQPIQAEDLSLSNRSNDFIASKLAISKGIPNNMYVRRYVHQSLVPFVSTLIPIENLQKVRLLSKNGIIIYGEQHQTDKKLLDYHLEANNMKAAHALISNLTDTYERNFFQIEELYSTDRKKAIVDLSKQISDTNLPVVEKENMISKLYYWIDHNSHQLDKESLSHVANSLGVEPSPSSILNNLVALSEKTENQGSKTLHMALDHLEKYDTQNRNRLHIYKSILQYQSDLTPLESIKIVAKLLNDLKHFEEGEFSQFVEEMDYRIWIPLIPQIFSLLGEHYALVKHIILKLGKHRLHSIIYPCMVRYLEHTKNSSEIVAELRKIDPEMVNSVQVFVTECKRMTHTWHDLWLQTLSGCRRYITKTGIKSQKFRMLLEQTYNVTMNTEPESKMEHQFQVQYQSILHMLYQSLLELSNRTTEVTDEEIELLKQRLSDLSNQLSRSSVFREFNVEDAVPKLLNPEVLKNIPIPGLHLYGHSEEDSLVTVESISSKVKVLGSKTKPKKIVLYGNNGKTYTFLLKGKEDLRLDQRMQQFINITNLVFKYDNCPSLRTRTYDVTPLGKNSGLIEWIDNTQTIFNLYRKKDSVYKPMDHYYKCLLPVLKSENVTKQPYSTSVLKKVYAKCKATIDKEDGINSVDTLMRHILFNPTQTSINSSFESQKNFVMSTACMSTIGYIVGLGDRHLDNILLDQFTNEVIHIDYQICFNQGSNLPVPEIVPFRMTPCISMAIGDTVMKSKFSSVCEQTLMSLHKERHLLLKLLMTFVNDPLLDQTSDQQLYSIFDKQLDSLFLEQVIEKKENINTEFKNTIENMTLLDVFGDLEMSSQSNIEEYCAIIENKKDKQQELDSLNSLPFSSIPVIKEKLEEERKLIALQKPDLSLILESQLKKFSDESHIHFNVFNTLRNKEFNMNFMLASIKSPSPLLHDILSYLTQVDSKEYFLKLSEIEEKQGAMRVACSELMTSMLDIQNIYKKYTDMEYVSHDIKYVISNIIHQILVCKEPSQFESIIKSISSPDPSVVESVEALDDEISKLTRDMNILKNKQSTLPVKSYGPQVVDCANLLNQLILEIVESTQRMSPSESSVYDLSDWCGFRNLLKIEGCTIYCHDNHPMTNMVPTSEQLTLLSTSIGSMTTAIKQFLDNLVFVLVPEFVKAISQSDLLNQLLTTIMALFESEEMTTHQKIMEYQTYINSSSTSAFLLCLAMDTQFSQLEAPFRELSLIPNVSDLLFTTKLDTLHDIFAELMNYDPVQNRSLFNILNIMKDHIDTFVEKITIPTLVATLQQWNIYDPSVVNKFESNEVLQHTIAKLTTDFEEFSNNFVQKIIIPRHNECLLNLQNIIWNNQHSGQLRIKNQDVLHWKESTISKLESNIRKFAVASEDLRECFLQFKNLENSKYLAICKPILNENQYNGLLTNISIRDANFGNIFQNAEVELQLARVVVNIEKKDRQLPFDTADMNSIYGNECYSALTRWVAIHEKEITLSHEYQSLIDSKIRHDELEQEIEFLNDQLKDPELVKVQSNQMHYADLIRSNFIPPYKQLSTKIIPTYVNMISQLVSVLQSMIELSSFHKSFRNSLQQFETKLTSHYELVNQYFVDCNDSLENKKDSMDSLFHYQHYKKLATRTNELKTCIEITFDYTIEQFNEISKQIEEQSYVENVDDEFVPPQQKNSNTSNYDGNFIVQLVGKKLNAADSEESVKSIVARQIEHATSEENLAKMYKGWIPWL